LEFSDETYKPIAAVAATVAAAGQDQSQNGAHV
jgi:hypothetical protein